VGELSQIRSDVDEARARVARQRKLIKLLRESGQDTQAAETVLTSMLETLSFLKEDQERLEDDPYRAAESG
jgi:hypothetical protein